MSVNKRLDEMNARQYALNIFKAITRGDETFSGYNKPKRTPKHPKKSHAVKVRLKSLTLLLKKLEGNLLKPDTRKI